MEGQGTTGGRVGQHQSHRAHQGKAGGATAALPHFALEQLCLLFHTTSFKLYYWYHTTGHSLCSKEPQAFFTILTLWQRKIALHFALISLNR